MHSPSFSEGVSTAARGLNKKCTSPLFLIDSARQRRLGSELENVFEFLTAYLNVLIVPNSISK